MKPIDLRQLVENELADRKRKNPHYSLRAFARDVGVSPTSISQVLNSRRTFSPKNREKFVSQLGLSPILARSTTMQRRIHIDETLLLKDDEFHLISDWFYLAILNLAKLPKNDADPEAIAERLGISSFVAANAIERLERLGFLRVKNRRLVRTSKALETTTNVPSEAIRKYHEQNLDRAKAALRTVPVELRDFSAVTGVICTKNLPVARSLIKEFRVSLSKLMEKGEPDEVYTLSVQLFPTCNSRSK